MTQPLIFISYSHKDEAEKDKLLSHFGVLQNAGLISLWSDDEIRAGTEWEREIDRAIAQARVAILLITANFLTSDFILGKEVPALLNRRQHEGLDIFAVIATACAWRMVDWLGNVQIRPKNGRPVWSEGGSHVDEDLAEIALEVAAIIRKPTPSPAGILAGKMGDQDAPLEIDSAIQTLDERDWESLLYRIKAGKCTPFIGPEVLRKIIPTDHEIARSWALEHAYPLADVQNMSRVAQFLAIKRDPAFPADELTRLLAGIKTPPNFDDPDEPHSLLARLPLPIYVTTNYDSYMTQALKHHHRNAYQEMCRWNRYVRDLPSVFDPGSTVNINPANPVVYHLFGHAEVPESMVLTEDDYIDFLVTISRNQSVIPRQVEKALVTTSLLFIGYQLSDFRFRILFRGVVAALERSLRRTSVAVQLTPEPAAGITPAHVREYLEEYLARDDGPPGCVALRSIRRRQEFTTQCENSPGSGAGRGRGGPPGNPGQGRYPARG
jgi:hypothetical protein